MSAYIQGVVAEAVCSALHSSDFEAIGESEDFTGALCSWFHRGRAPQDVRVCVRRLTVTDFVEVTIEWRNFAKDARLRGKQTITLPCSSESTTAYDEPVRKAVVRCLEIFRDVLNGTGVAGPIVNAED